MVIIVIGSKGGVGTTTLTAGLAEASGVAVQLIDLSGTGDLAYVTARRPASLDDIARLPDHSLEQAARQASRQAELLALSETGRLLYAGRVARILDVMEAHSALLIDGGLDLPHPVLELASTVVLLVTPDPRSLRRASRFAQQHGDIAVRSLPVLNRARQGQSCELSGQAPPALPDIGRAHPLRSPEWQKAVQALAAQLGLEADAKQAQAHTARQAFDWKALIPQIRFVD